MKLTFRNYINWLYEGVEDKLATISLKTKIPIEKLQQIFEGDPTPNKMYVNWLVKLQISGNLRFPEDKERTIEVLNDFNKIKNNPQFKQQYSNDIGQYKSIQDLLTVVRKFKGINPERKSQNIIPAGAKEVYNDGTYQVIAVLTPDAAEIMFKNSEWCVRNKNTANNYLGQSYLFLLTKSGYNYALIAMKKDVDFDSMGDDINDMVDDQAEHPEDYNEDSLILTKDYKDVNDENPSQEMINELHNIWAKAGVLPDDAIYGRVPVFANSEYIPTALYYYISSYNVNDIIPDILMTNEVLEPMIGDIIGDMVKNYGYYVPHPDYYNNGDFMLDDNNMLHNSFGAALEGEDVMSGNSFMIYCQQGKIHRKNGPAVFGDSYKMWVNNGKVTKK